MKIFKRDISNEKFDVDWNETVLDQKKLDFCSGEMGIDLKRWENLTFLTVYNMADSFKFPKNTSFKTDFLLFYKPERSFLTHF